LLYNACKIQQNPTVGVHINPLRPPSQ